MRQEIEASAGAGDIDAMIAAADALTATADQAQEQLKTRLDACAVSVDTAQRVYTSINNLRYAANMLYTESAGALASELADARQAALGVIDEARQAIARQEKIERVVDLVADLVTLAAALKAGKPGTIVASIREIAADVRGLDTGLA